MSGASITDLIQSELREGILTVRINRPEKKNALNLAMYQALADGLRYADSEDAVRVILLTGCDSENRDVFTLDLLSSRRL